MSASKSLHKRELENSPAKKISREIVSVSTDVDDTIVKAVLDALALAEQQETFNTSILAAVKEAMDSVVVPQLVVLKVHIKQANEAVHNGKGGTLEQSRE